MLFPQKIPQYTHKIANAKYLHTIFRNINFTLIFHYKSTKKI